MKLLNVRLAELLKGWSRRRFASKDGPPALLDDEPPRLKPQLTTSEPCAVGPCYTQPRIVIIGAGLAGLSAAHRLVQCGIDSFTVLEAIDRPGGRIHSSWLGDVVAELGAQHCPGEKRTDSPLYSMAISNELARPRSENTRGLFERPAGGDADLSITVTAYQKFRQIEKEAAQLFCYGGYKQHGSMLNFIGMRIQQELREYPEEQQYDAARIMFGMTSVLRSKCGDDLSLMSADKFGSYVEMPGGEVRVPLGAIAALAPLMREIPDCVIRYRKPVNVVHWGTAQKAGCRAVVRCCDGEEFPADYVIVTVSMGVLRCFADKMFCPTLPSLKTDALRYLGWEMCNKVFLDYSRPFWFWSRCDLRFEFGPGELAGRYDWTRGIVLIKPVPESEHVLYVRVEGPDAATMETLCDRDVAEGITRLLRQRTGIDALPYPATMLRSRWATDQYFCGAYSSSGSGCGCCCDEAMTARFRQELGQPLPGPSDPVPPVLLFAGEATVPGHGGTAAGARLSGVREAERVVQLTNRFRGPPLPPVDPALTPEEVQAALANVKRDCDEKHAQS